jgi:hypothetical protein
MFVISSFAQKSQTKQIYLVPTRQRSTMSTGSREPEKNIFSFPRAGAHRYTQVIK